MFFAVQNKGLQPVDIDSKVREVICEQLGLKPEDVTPEADLIQNLGVDSLDSVELVMALEEEFGIEVLDEDAEKLKKVSDITQYIHKKLNEKK